jgi:hypothetical protein
LSEDAAGSGICLQRISLFALLSLMRAEGTARKELLQTISFDLFAFYTTAI